jgi:hypothetical protein
MNRVPMNGWMLVVCKGCYSSEGFVLRIRARPSPVPRSIRFRSSTQRASLHVSHAEINASLCLLVRAFTDLVVDLSLCSICLGRGPAFRKRDVENAIRLATLDDSWALNPVCEIP